MSNDAARIKAASALRELSHDFVGRDLSDAQLDDLARRLDDVLGVVRSAPLRERTATKEHVESFKFVFPDEQPAGRQHFFLDSVVSGGANPMGLDAMVRRDADVAVMEVSFGKAFEGAPGRAHGGVVAALIDETMGFVSAIHGLIAFTAQLNITFLSPSPINERVVARAWRTRHEGRKQYVEAEVRSGDSLIATAEAVFITIDVQKFLEHIIIEST